MSSAQPEKSTLQLELETLKRERAIKWDEYKAVEEVYLNSVQPQRNTLRRQMNQLLGELDELECRIKDIQKRLTLDYHAYESPVDPGANSAAKRVYFGPPPYPTHPLYTSVWEELRKKYAILLCETKFHGGYKWRDEFLKDLRGADLVVIHWREQSYWSIVAATVAKVLSKKLVIICYEGDVAPEPFSDDAVVRLSTENDVPNVLSVIEQKTSEEIVTEREVSVDEFGKEGIDMEKGLSVDEFGKETLEAAFYEELKKPIPPGSTRRETFEKKFEVGVRKNDLQIFEEQLVLDWIDKPFSEKPRGYMRDGFQLRYELGAYLSELRGLPEDSLALSDPIPLEGNRPFRAMRYLVTRHVYTEYLLAVGKPECSLAPTRYYEPWTISSQEIRNNPDWLKEIEEFIGWLSSKKFDGKQLHLPTFKQWQEIAGPLSRWSDTRILQCNLNCPQNTSASISAVGVFLAGESHGCHDVIGNTWELVTDQDGLPAAVGWSYRTQPRVIGLTWLDFKENLDNLRNSEPIGFRLVAS